MKILIINKFGENRYIETDILPRIGDNVDMFYKPCPKVDSVTLYVSIDTLKTLGINEKVDAIVTVA